MDALVLVLIVMAAGVVAVPLAVSYGIYWFIRRQGFDRRL